MQHTTIQQSINCSITLRGHMQILYLKNESHYLIYNIIIFCNLIIM